MVALRFLKCVIIFVWCLKLYVYQGEIKKERTEMKEWFLLCVFMCMCIHLRLAFYSWNLAQNKIMKCILFYLRNFHNKMSKSTPNRRRSSNNRKQIPCSKACPGLFLLSGLAQSFFSVCQTKKKEKKKRKTLLFGITVLNLNFHTGVKEIES